MPYIHVFKPLKPVDVLYPKRVPIELFHFITCLKKSTNLLMSSPLAKSKKSWPKMWVQCWNWKWHHLSMQNNPSCTTLLEKITLWVLYSVTCGSLDSCKSWGRTVDVFSTTLITGLINGAPPSLEILPLVSSSQENKRGSVFGQKGLKSTNQMSLWNQKNILKLNFLLKITITNLIYSADVKNICNEG